MTKTETETEREEAEGHRTREREGGESDRDRATQRHRGDCGNCQDESDRSDTNCALHKICSRATTTVVIASETGRFFVSLRPLAPFYMIYHLIIVCVRERE